MNGEHWKKVEALYDRRNLMVDYNGKLFVHYYLVRVGIDRFSGFE